MEVTKSEQIRAGLQRSFQSVASAKASTVCYGYKISLAGELVIDPTEANTVLFIFHHFHKWRQPREDFWRDNSHGHRLPYWQVTWSREIISKLLANEKYLGRVILQKAFVADCLSHKQTKNAGQCDKYENAGNHKAIIDNGTWSYRNLLNLINSISKTVLYR